MPRDQVKPTDMPYFTHMLFCLHKTCQPVSFHLFIDFIFGGAGFSLLCGVFSGCNEHGLFSSCFPGGSGGKESACNEGDLGSTPGWGRSPGGGHGNPLQHSCLENPMDRGAMGSQSRTRLKRLSSSSSCSNLQPHSSFMELKYQLKG